MFYVQVFIVFVHTSTSYLFFLSSFGAMWIIDTKGLGIGVRTNMRTLHMRTRIGPKATKHKIKYLDIFCRYLLLQF